MEYHSMTKCNRTEDPHAFFKNSWPLLENNKNNVKYEQTVWMGNYLMLSAINFKSSSHNVRLKLTDIILNIVRTAISLYYS